METEGIRGETSNLKNLFQTATYRIDYYQREYSWGADDVQAILLDLVSAFRSTVDQPAPEPYFLGPFVYVDLLGPATDEPQRYLVDGQQRFSTVHLLFLHLYRRVKDLGLADSADLLQRVIGSYDRRIWRFRVDIPDRRDLLEALFRGRRYELPTAAPVSVRNLWSRSQEMAETLDDLLPPDRYEDFVSWLLHDVVLVGIRAPSRAGGFRIFESMNDRGARLTSVDLLKGFLLSNAGGGEEELNAEWRRMLSELSAWGADGPRRFLHAVIIGRLATVDGPGSPELDRIDRSLNLWLRSHSEELGLHRAKDYRRFVEQLFKLARFYGEIAAASARLPDDGPPEVYFNARNGLTAQDYLMMAVIDPDDPPSDARAKVALVAAYLDWFLVDRMVRDEATDPADSLAEVLRLIPLLRACDGVADVARTLRRELPAGDFAAVHGFGLRGNNRPAVRYVLARMTHFVESACGQPGHGRSYVDGSVVPQIEHLFANRPERFAGELDEAEFRVLRSRLGALVLLPAQVNASYSDLPLDRKVGLYVRSNILAATLDPTIHRNNPALRQFLVTYGLRYHVGGFEPGAPIEAFVEARAEFYVNLCRRIWDPTRLGFDGWSALDDDPGGQLRSG